MTSGGPIRLLATLLMSTALLLPAAASAAPNLFVTDTGGQDVSQFGLRAAGGLFAGSPATVSLGGFPDQITVSPDGRSAYVAIYSIGKVAQYDISPLGLLVAKSPSTVATGSSPVGITLSPDGASAYVTDG